jgi:hypothetical protein
MMILGFLFGIVVILILLTAGIGFTIGLAIAVVRYIRNPASLITDIKSRFTSRTKPYGR